MKQTVSLPEHGDLVIDDQALEPYRALRSGAEPPPVRRAWAAAHVVLRDSYRDVPHSLARPGTADEIAPHVDWDATLALRRRLDRHGFGVAEAMDTAQRFFLGWALARELIQRTGRAGLRHGFVAGAGADQRAAVPDRTTLVDAVVEQVAVIRAAGGIPLLLPLPWLCQTRASEQEFVQVYADVVRQVEGPLLVHWLGEQFLPALRGYFPGRSFSRVMALDPEKVRGCKLSLLDAEQERRIRAELLPRDQVVLTGDDLHFADLIHGDGDAPAPVQRMGTLGGDALPLGGFSHALLGILDGVAAPAGLALRFLARGDSRQYFELMRPCEELGRWLFQQPVQHYKAGLAFLSWLDGHQDNPLLVNHEERARDAAHYRQAAVLAARARVFTSAPTVVGRLADLA